MKKTLDEARKEINRIDKEMARLFEERMRCAEAVAEYKRESGMPIFDPEREAEIIDKNSALICKEELRHHYVRFLQELMNISKDYQAEILSK